MKKEIEDVYIKLQNYFAAAPGGPGGNPGGCLHLTPAPINFEEWLDKELPRLEDYEEKETLPPILSVDDKDKLHENVKKNLGYKDRKEVAYMCPTCWEIFDEFEVMRKHHKDSHGATVGSTKELYQCERKLVEGAVDPCGLTQDTADFIPTLYPGETLHNIGAGRYELSKKGITIAFTTSKPLTKELFDKMRESLHALYT